MVSCDNRTQQHKTWTITLSMTILLSVWNMIKSNIWFEHQSIWHWYQTQSVSVVSTCFSTDTHQVSIDVKKQLFGAWQLRQILLNVQDRHQQMLKCYDKNNDTFLLISTKTDSSTKAVKKQRNTMRSETFNTSFFRLYLVKYR